MKNTQFPSSKHLAEDWVSFWKPGTDKKKLTKLIEKAALALDSANRDQAEKALLEFVSVHQYFPVSKTDGAPLAYGQNIKDFFNGDLNRIVDQFSKAIISDVKAAKKKVLMSKLYCLIGDYQAADMWAEEAVKIAPNFAEGYLQLAKTSRMYSLPEKVIKCLRKAVHLTSGRADYLYLLGDFLQICQLDQEAVEAFSKALERRPDYSKAHYGLCWSLRRLGKVEEAVYAGEEAVRLTPNSHTFFHLIYALLAAGKNEEAITRCHEALALNPMDPAAFAFLSTALYETGQHEEGRAICDFENLLKVMNISPPPGYSSLASFNQSLVEVALAAPTRIMDPTQTNNLFLSSSGPFCDFKDTINRVVKMYYDSFSSTFKHPFLSQKMENWRIDGWATRLKKMDEQEHHFHNHAWLSGVYYAKLPGGIGRGVKEEGCIEFCRFRSYSASRAKAELATIRPEEGIVVLFPSYFYHRILPFQEDDYRVSIAFNFIPES